MRPSNVIATGLFTDGGTINLGSIGPSAVIKLGAGNIRLTTRAGKGRVKVNHATCLTTLSGHGTYKLSHGTGNYAGIRGSGHYTTTLRTVSPRKKSGACAFNSRPLAQQGIVTLTGSATLHN